MWTNFLLATYRSCPGVVFEGQSHKDSKSPSWNEALTAQDEKALLQTKQDIHQV